MLRNVLRLDFIRIPRSSRAARFGSAKAVAVRAAGLGTGRVVAVTYEYGNAFVIVAGLLNLLVVVDVYDVAVGRK